MRSNGCLMFCFWCHLQFIRLSVEELGENTHLVLLVPGGSRKVSVCVCVCLCVSISVIVNTNFVIFKYYCQSSILSVCLRMSVCVYIYMHACLMCVCM